MSKYFTSDWHLDHKLMIELGHRPFKTLNEMNKTIVQNLLNILESGDQLYFLGDLSWSIKAYKDFFAQFPHDVEFHWILGNHDKKQYKQYERFVTSVGDTKEIYIGNKIPVYMNHYPHLTWNKSHFNAFHLFGHHHIGSNGNSKLDKMINGKMLNVNCEFHYYEPWSEDEIIKHMEKRPDNWDLIRKN